MIRNGDIDVEKEIGDLIYLFHISPTELFGMTLTRIDWLYSRMVKTDREMRREK